LGGSLLHLAPTETALSLLSLDQDLRGVVDAQLKRLYARALELVRARKGAVEAVANALGERRVLSGAEVAEIMAAADAPNQQGGHDV
jgi:ATP-dependent Zn protease